MDIVSSFLAKYMSNASIFPMFGNHEDCPVDEYDLYGNGSDYLKEAGAKYWG